MNQSHSKNKFGFLENKKQKTLRISDLNKSSQKNFDSVKTLLEQSKTLREEIINSCIINCDKLKQKKKSHSEFRSEPIYQFIPEIPQEIIRKKCEKNEEEACNKIVSKEIKTPIHFLQQAHSSLFNEQFSSNIPEKQFSVINVQNNVHHYNQNNQHDENNQDNQDKNQLKYKKLEKKVASLTKFCQSIQVKQEKRENYHSKKCEKYEKVAIFVKTCSIYECNVTLHSSRDILPQIDIYYELKECSDQEINEEGSYQKALVPLSSENGCLINIFWENCQWIVKIYTGFNSVALSFDEKKYLKYFHEGIYQIVIR